MRSTLLAAALLVPLQLLFAAATPAQVPTGADGTTTTVPAALPAVVPTTMPVPATTAVPAPTSTLVALRPGPVVSVRFDVLPRSAVVTIRPAGAPPVSVKAQGTARVASGAVPVEISAPGYRTRTETLAVTAAGQVIARRLDPVAQLHRHRYDARTGSNPKQVAFTPSGNELWVTLLGSHGVDVFRAMDGVRLATIRLGDKGGAVEVVFNAAGTRAYVSQMETASVYEIDTATRKVLRRMPTGGNWTKVLALSPDETLLYAANWVSNDVSVLELATGKLLRRIPTVRTPRGLAFDPTGRRLFVAGFDGGEIQRIDLVTGIKVVLLRTGGAMRHMAVDPAAQVIYADDMGTAKVYAVDMRTEQVRTLASTDSHPNTIDLSPDARVLYVSNRGENNAKGYNIPGPEWGSVLVIDVATGAPLDAIVAGNQTTGLDVSPDGRTLAFTDFLDNRLAVYDIPAPEVLAAGGGGLAPSRRALIVKP